MADTSAQHSGVAAGSARKGGNPNTDYKIRYLKCKDKFDRVSSVSTKQADIDGTWYMYN